MSDLMLNDLFLTGRQNIDITTLSGVDGRFLTYIKNALKQLNDWVGRTNPPDPKDPRAPRLHVRYLYGDCRMDSNEVLKQLTEDLNPLHLRVSVNGYYFGNLGYCRPDGAGLGRWNHSKVIVVDGAMALVGGHNLWSGDYLGEGPVSDVSMHVRGPAAHYAARYTQALWQWPTFLAHPLCNSAASVPDFHAGFLEPKPGCMDPYRSLRPQPGRSDTPVIAVGTTGRAGGGFPRDEYDDAGDDALFAMIDSAQDTIKISQQDLLSQPSIWPWGRWLSDALMEHLGNALARRVEVFIALSDGFGEPLGQYGVVPTSETYEEIHQWLLTHRGSWSTKVQQIMCDQMHVAPIRRSPDKRWYSPEHPHGVKIRNHAKFMMVDDSAFYIGSQNLYPSGLSTGETNITGLAEFGFIVDSREKAGFVLEQYWNHLWTWSRVDEHRLNTCIRHPVAFARDGDIWIMDASGANQVQLTKTAAWDTHPAMSPDSGQIAFTRYEDTSEGGTGDIWVIGADGSRTEQLTFDLKDDDHPTWSPDGGQIAFASNRDTDYHQLYLMRADGSLQVPLTGPSGALYEYSSSPAWSPSGRQIAFVSNRDGNQEIYVLDTMAPNRQTRLTTTAEIDDDPAWSPDGCKIAFSSLPENGGRSRVSVMDANGLNVYQPRPDTPDQYDPAWTPRNWSPGGSTLLFHGAHERDSRADIYDMRAQDGGALSNLTNHRGESTSPSTPLSLDPPLADFQVCRVGDVTLCDVAGCERRWAVTDLAP